MTIQNIIIHKALADGANVALFPDLAKADPVSYIVGGFNYVAGFIAALVVLVALWGVIKLMSHPGSSTDKSESRGIFWNLLLGVLFFALIYFFFTTILSPDLGTLRLPSLTQLKDQTSIDAQSPRCNPACSNTQICTNPNGTPVCAAAPAKTTCTPACSSTQHCETSSIQLGNGTLNSGGSVQYQCVDNPKT